MKYLVPSTDLITHRDHDSFQLRTFGVYISCRWATIILGNVKKICTNLGLRSEEMHLMIWWNLHLAGSWHWLKICYNTDQLFKGILRFIKPSLTIWFHTFSLLFRMLNVYLYTITKCINIVILVVKHWLFQVHYLLNIILIMTVGAPPWSSGSVLDHRSLLLVFETRRGHIWRLFHLWLRLITFGGRSAHLAYCVHKSGCKTSIISINYDRCITRMCVSVCVFVQHLTFSRLNKLLFIVNVNW